MASLNHSIIIKGFEKLASDRNPNDFFFDFLKVLKFPAATIKRLREPGSNRNVAIIQGDLALEKQIYFHKARSGEDLQNTLRSIVEDPQLNNRKIRFFMTTDYENVVAYDKRVDDWTNFAFKDLRENYEFFLPLTGLYEKPLAYSAHPADVKACEKMGKLYDVIKAQNHYDNEHLHDLNVFLTRLLFCFFAEDTGIFPKEGQLTNAIESITKADGSDLANFFERLFWILDMSPNHPGRSYETATLAAFPYVNGGLFHEKIQIPQFNAKARNILLECGHLAWHEISPVIFGAMFQTVMDPELRHERGEHYTSEENILKVIGPLFLDNLKDELNKLLTDKSTHRNKKLKEFQEKLASLKFLDPACGCGNFLIVTYRELKRLELQTVKAIYCDDKNPSLFDDWREKSSRVSISQFYGFEIEEFPVDVARVSMWLMEHVMNREFSEFFGQLFPSIPLKDSANIICTNALTNNWSSLAPIHELDFIFGNPPFGGIKTTTKEQKEEIALVFENKKVGNLDYVGCWFKKAADCLAIHHNIKAAFVATNSITQGEQAQTLWEPIFNKWLSIQFAHTSFKWMNEAKGVAAVYCVIIGFSARKQEKKSLYFYEKPTSEPYQKIVNNINAYLIDSNVNFIPARSKSICDIPNMCYGNMPASKSLILNHQEFISLKQSNPKLASYVRKFHSAKQFLNGEPRYCIWLYGLSEAELSEIPNIKLLEEKVSLERTDPKTGQLRKHYDNSSNLLFHQITQPLNCDCLLIPRHSSENRDYIPMGFIPQGEIIGDSCQVVANTSLFHFGILESRMHMTWMRTVCGRLKGDYRYSRDLCYNTFPWPKASESEKNLIENLSQNILMTREYYPDMTLANLYDPDKMPEDLKKAHSELDLAVERLYRKKPFESDEDRLHHLFERYERLIKGEDDSNLFF